jgi:tRNA threonylcarbamoyladenosine biosynthesis protein TsaB
MATRRFVIISFDDRLGIPLACLAALASAAATEWVESGFDPPAYHGFHPLKILALETSTELCSATLWVDGEVDAREALAGQRHSELLLPMIDALLVNHGFKAADLDCIAFGAGPGSFTGLRIACGVAQGMAFGISVPVVGVSTLLALAAASRAGRAVCCLDARMGEVYHAAYEKRAGAWHAVHEPGLYKPDATPDLPGGAWTGCGSGFAAYRAALESRYAGKLARVIDNLTPHAREIAALAAAEFGRGGAVSAELAAPLYVRNKVALRMDER